MRSFAYVELNEDSYREEYKSCCALAQSTQLILKSVIKLSGKAESADKSRKKWEYFKST